MTTLSLRTDAGERFQLACEPGSRLGAGGQGRVYLARIGAQEMAVKLVSPVDADRLGALRRLEAECGAVATLPLRLVHDPAEDDRLVGYAMRPIEMGRSVSCSRLFNFEEIGRLQRYTWRDAVFAALRLAKSVAMLHRHGVVIGDLNPENVLFEQLMLPAGGSTWRAVVLDTDSFQIRDPRGRDHFCPVSRPAYTAPELIGSDYRRTWRHRSADDFSLAVVIYQLLLHDHPFDNAINTLEPDLNVTAKIRRGLYPHASSPPPAVKAGQFRPAPAEICDAIHRAFRRSFHPEATRRPTAMEWVRLLADLHQRVVPCSVSPYHHHPRGRDCPWCAVERRLRQPLCRFPTGGPAPAASPAPAPAPTPAPSPPAPATPRPMPPGSSSVAGQAPKHSPGCGGSLGLVVTATLLGMGVSLSVLPRRTLAPTAVEPSAPSAPGQQGPPRITEAESGTAEEPKRLGAPPSPSLTDPRVQAPEPLSPHLEAPSSPPVTPGASGPTERSCTLLGYRGVATQQMGCSLSRRVNSQGHSVYDLAWADGDRSIYVFWSGGVVEVLGTLGSGRKTEGSYRLVGGAVEIRTREGLTIRIPSFQPSLN